MNPHISLRRVSDLSYTIGIALFFAAWSQNAQAARRQEQQSSQQPQQASQPSQSPQTSSLHQYTSGPKPKKVWTNDDVVSLRSPADNYMAEKEAQQIVDANAVAQKADLVKQIKQAGLTIELPRTSEETQRLIKEREERIKIWQESRDRLSQVSSDASPDQKASTQKQIEALTCDSLKAQLELEVLQDYLQDLAKPTLKEDEA